MLSLIKIKCNLLIIISFSERKWTKKKQSATALPIVNNNNEVPQRIGHLKCVRKQNQLSRNTIDIGCKKNWKFKT